MLYFTQATISRLWRSLLNCRCLLILVAIATTASAQTEVEDCSEEAFRTALSLDDVVVFTNDCTITLTNPVFIGDGGDTFGSDVTIDAQGHHVTISGNNQTSIFQLTNGGSLTAYGLTIAAGGGSNIISGSALTILSGTVVLSNCVIAGNQVVGGNGLSGTNGLDDLTGDGTSGFNGASGTNVFGGAICNLGELSLWNCTLTNNSAKGGDGGSGGNGGSGGRSLSRGGDGGSGGRGGMAIGGAIYNLGSLLLSNCTMGANSASGGNAGAGGSGGSGFLPGRTGNGALGGNAAGGGIFSTNAYGTNNVTIVGCTFSDNSILGGSGSSGGTSSTGDGVPGGQGGDAFGGGLYLAASTDPMETDYGTLTNCTFFNDTARGGGAGNGGPGFGRLARAGRGGRGGNGRGGGLFAYAKVETNSVVNCTFSMNGAFGGTNGAGGSANFPGVKGGPSSGAGAHLASGGTAFHLELLGSLFSTNSTRYGIGFFGLKPHAERNVSWDMIFRPTGINKRKRKLNVGSLANNGGPTKTIAIFTNSPARDYIPAEETGYPTDDQRGAPRAESLLDAGAYELLTDIIITEQPQSLSRTNGESATFSVTAFGESLHYQWRFNGTNNVGADSSSFTIAHVSPINAGAYHVIIKNSTGSTNVSDDAILTVHSRPVITAQPTNQTASVGSNATFQVSAAGDAPLAYQWLFFGSNLPSATASALTITNAQISNAGPYAVFITNSFGAVTSSTARLDVTSAAPAIVTDPRSQTVNVSSNASITVAAAGAPPLAFQWQKNGTNLANATSSALAVNNAQTNDAGAYRAIITNAYGSATSGVATLTVATLLPIITSPPESKTVLSGSDVTMAVGATSSSPMTYQWRFNSGTLAGAVGPSFSINSVQPEDAGAYDVVVGNSSGSIRSPKAILTVVTQVNRPTLVSTRSNFSFNSIGGATYVLEYKTNLASANWQTLSTNAGTGGLMTLPDSINYSSRFYRLRVQ